MAYSARADVEQVFGVTNVSKWGDLDNDDDASNIEARITAAIAYADARLESILRPCHLKIPFVTQAAATPTMITELSAKLAGLWLYEARGSADYDQRSGKPMHRYAFMRSEVRRTLMEIRDGILQTDAI